MAEKTLDVKITHHGDIFEVSVFDSETGTYWDESFAYSPDEHPVFDMEIGAEIYYWVTQLYERMMFDVPRR